LPSEKVVIKSSAKNIHRDRPDFFGVGEEKMRDESEKKGFLRVKGGKETPLFWISTRSDVEKKEVQLQHMPRTHQGEKQGKGGIKAGGTSKFEGQGFLVAYTSGYIRGGLGM